MTDSRCTGSTRFSVTSLPAIAAATRKVPASMRSGMTSCSAPCSSFTPSMMIRRVPAPSIFAPILLSKFARSMTSGSAAALSMTVVPSARTAAIMTLSVPRTVGPSLPRRFMVAAAQFPGENLHVALVDPVSGAERLEAFQMKIDRAVADDAAAGQGDRRLLLAAEQGTEDADGGAHLPHDLVGRDRFDVLRADRHGAARPLHLRAEMGEDLQHVVDVAEIRNVVDDDRLFGEQGGGENRQGRVLGAADFDGARQRVAAVNENFIHVLRKRIGCGLGSRLWNGCREICGTPILRDTRARLIVADLQREIALQVLLALGDQAVDEIDAFRAAVQRAAADRAALRARAPGISAAGMYGRLATIRSNVPSTAASRSLLINAHALCEPEAAGVLPR